MLKFFLFRIENVAVRIHISTLAGRQKWAFGTGGARRQDSGAQFGGFLESYSKLFIPMMRMHDI